MAKIVDRIGMYAEKKNISIRRIEQEIGASNGTLSKVSLFSTKFTDVNPVWLLTGKGEMILMEKDESTTSASKEESKEAFNSYEARMRHLEELIKMHQEKNKLLEDLVEQLKSK